MHGCVVVQEYLSARSYDARYDLVAALCSSRVAVSRRALDRTEIDSRENRGNEIAARSDDGAG